MMNNLFSVFDPSSSLFIFPNWASTFIVLIMIFPMFWLAPNPINLFIMKVKLILHSEIKTLLGPQSPNGSTMILMGTLYFIVFNNFMGLFPYIFTSTSHLVVTLSLSLPLWIAFMLYGWLNYTKYMLAHLVPQGTPSALMSFMVMIETVSNMIRPGTLAIRLSANMIAGHLLLTLLGNQTASGSFLIVPGLLITQVLLLTLECVVAVQIRSSCLVLTFCSCSLVIFVHQYLLMGSMM